jgi:biotin carboxylase
VDRFVVEEFVPGPEVSVETMSSGGRHVVLAITEKLLQPDGFVEIGHALPARLAPPTAEAVRSATASALDAIGLRDGPSHTEFRLQDGVPRLIETHNRVGGDRIHDLVEAACGVDLDRLWIGGPVGLVPPLAGPPPVSRAAATRFVLAEPGEVVAIDGVEEVHAHPAVIGFDLSVGVGDRVGQLRTSWDRIGQVLVTAPTTATAVALADDLAARIRVVTR